MNDYNHILLDLASNTLNRTAQMLHDSVQLVDSGEEVVTLMTIIAVTTATKYIEALDSYLPDVGLKTLTETEQAIAVNSALTRLLIVGEYKMPSPDRFMEVMNVANAIFDAIEAARHVAGYTPELAK